MQSRCSLFHLLLRMLCPRLELFIAELAMASASSPSVVDMDSRRERLRASCSALVIPSPRICVARLSNCCALQTASGPNKRRTKGLVDRSNSSRTLGAIESRFFSKNPTALYLMVLCTGGVGNVKACVKRAWKTEARYEVVEGYG
jgi:hypothetical protein